MVVRPPSTNNHDLRQSQLGRSILLRTAHAAFSFRARPSNPETQRSAARGLVAEAALPQPAAAELLELQHCHQRAGEERPVAAGDWEKSDVGGFFSMALVPALIGCTPAN